MAIHSPIGLVHGMRRSVFWIFLLTILALINCSSWMVQAQGADTGWSTPTLIMETTGSLASGAMTLIEDSHGNLHLFFPHQPSEKRATGIDHMFWNGASWSEPVTVILNADKSPVMNISGAITQQDQILLLWGGGSNRLYFAQAPASLAADAKAWSTPTTIGLAVTEAGITVDPNGVIWAAYADMEMTGCLTLVSSDDGGLRWSMARCIMTSPEGTMPGKISLVADSSGRLHVAWSGFTLPAGEPFTGVYYMRSIDGGQTWKEARQFDDERHGEIGIGLGPNDEVHVVWRSNIGGDGTFHQWSPDGGDSWLPPDPTNDNGGMSGMPSFGLDSGGALHMTIGRAFVATWADKQLSPWVGVARDRLYTNADQDPNWTEPERAVLAVRNGNEVHVVFETGFKKLWHTSRRLALPAAPRTPVADQMQPSSKEPPNPATPNPEPLPEATPTLPAMVSKVRTAPTPNSLLVNLVGPLVAALLVFVVIIVRLTGRRH